MSIWSLPTAQPLSRVLEADTVLTTGSEYSLGAYYEIVAATSEDIDYLEVVVAGDQSSSVRSFLEIAVGAAGSEETLIPYMAANNIVRAEQEVYSTVGVPFSIKKGNRIAVRGAKLGNGENIFTARLRGYKRRADVVSRFSQKGIAYGCGINQGASALQAGQALTAGNSVWGSWVEISSSAEQSHDLLSAHVFRAGETSDPHDLELNIGTGPVGAEQVIGSVYAGKAGTSYSEIAPAMSMIQTHISKGERIAIRGKNYGGARNVIVGIVGY